MTDYAKVLSRRYPGVEWVLNGNSYEGLTILDGSEIPSKKSLDDAWESVKAEIEAEQQAKVDARASALAKLAALGLTDEEINAIIGGV